MSIATLYSFTDSFSIKLLLRFRGALERVWELKNAESRDIFVSTAPAKCKDATKQFNKLTEQAALRLPVGCNIALFIY